MLCIKVVTAFAINIACVYLVARMFITIPPRGRTHMMITSVVSRMFNDSFRDLNNRLEAMYKSRVMKEKDYKYHPNIKIIIK